MANEEYQYPPNFTFIPEEIPPATSFIQSSVGLRSSFVIRQQALLITDMIIKGGKDPNDITEQQWEEYKAEWKKEAEIKYPDIGDYKIWLVDPETKEPVPIGEVVEFIGGAVRDNPGILPCIEYFLELSGEIIPDPDTFIVTVNYTDCTITQVTISDTAAKLQNLSICVGQATTPITSAGEFIEVAPCYLPGDLPACEQYSWDLTGVPLNSIVSLGFTNCEGNSEKIEGKPAELGTLVNFCAVKDSPVTFSGVINYIGGPCVNPYNPNNNL
jgi:hypothetical protein